jgi:hypothetical protein
MQITLSIRKMNQEKKKKAVRRELKNSITD